MSPAERVVFVGSEEFYRIAARDPELVKSILDDAADTGLIPVDSEEYGGFLSWYWQQVALGQAGIDPATWDPSLGTGANWETVRGVYEYYGDIYVSNPDLQWAAMAHLIGPSFAGGMQDLEYLGQWLEGDRVGPAAEWVSQWRFEVGAEEVKAFEIELLAMQQEIFYDMAQLHEAYIRGGMEEINRLRTADVIDRRTYDAWVDIDSGTPHRVEKGNQHLLRREQEDIIADNYDALRDMPGGGGAMTQLMTVAGKASIPGAASFAETFNSGDISIFEHRWELIKVDTWPVFVDLVNNDPRWVVDVIHESFDDQVEGQRFTNSVDGMVGVSVDLEVGFTGELSPPQVQE